MLYNILAINTYRGEPTMKSDLILIKTLILARGLNETIAIFGAACSEMALELSPAYADDASTLMQVATRLDRISSFLEQELPQDHEFITG
jgi:hypothetical protein